jgi:predicted ATP-dependent endonuclease of OLD family
MNQNLPVMEDIFITQIIVNKVRHLSNLTIPLSETERKHLILTGKNGSGKTSVLETMRDFVQAYSHKNLKHDGSIKYDGSFMYANFDTFEHAVEKITLVGNAPFDNIRDTLFFYFPASHNLKLDMPQTIEKVAPTSSTDFLKYMIDLDYQRLGAMKDKNYEEERRIDAWFNHFEKILCDIYECTELKLKAAREGKDFKIIMPNREPFGLNEMADGYSALLNIVMELMMRMESTASGTYDMPGIVLVDEIETHLHVELQKRALPFLTKMFPKIQFIVTTHSPFVISSLENAVVFDLDIIF